MELSKEQYKKALLTEGILKDRSLELLSSLFDAPSCEATAQQLSVVLGYEGFPPVNASSHRGHTFLRLRFSAYPKCYVRSKMQKNI